MKHNFRLRPLQCAVLLSLTYFANGAYALKLGDPVVKSYVGQPLVAEFTIEDSTREELKMLKIALAKPETYGSLKALFHPSLKTSSLSIVDKDSLKPKLVFKTNGPVEDSVVDLVFELTWAAGKMIQASTVLIDPAPEGTVIDTPVFEPMPVPVIETKPAPQPTIQTVVPSEPVVPVKPTAPVSTKKGVAKTLPSLPSKTNPTSEMPQKETEITVKRGDTLGNIASRHAMPGVKLEQLLIAIYDKNSKVIASANINLIQEGTVLALPTKEEALAVDAKTAMQTVALHASNFRLYAQKLAATSKPVAANSSTETKSTTGRVQSEVKDQTHKEVTGQDTVKVAKGTTGAAVGNTTDKTVATPVDKTKPSSAVAAKAAEDKATAERVAIEKDIQTKKALVEAKERQAMLDKNAKDLADLVRLKNEQLAKLQQNTQKAANTPAPVSKAPVEKSTPDVKSSDAKPLTPEAIAAARHAAANGTTPATTVEKPVEKPVAPAVTSTEKPTDKPVVPAGTSTEKPTDKPVTKEVMAPPVVETPTLPDALAAAQKNTEVNPLATAQDGKAENADAKPVVKPKKVPKPITAPIAPPPEPEFDLTEYLVPVGVGGAGIFALIMGWIYSKRKKKVNHSESPTIFGDNSGKDDADSESRDTTASALDSRLDFGSIAASRKTEVERSMVHQDIMAASEPTDKPHSSKAISLNNPIVHPDKTTELPPVPGLLHSTTPSMPEALDSVFAAVDSIPLPTPVRDVYAEAGLDTSELSEQEVNPLEMVYEPVDEMAPKALDEYVPDFLSQPEAQPQVELEPLSFLDTLVPVAPKVEEDATPVDGPAFSNAHDLPSIPFEAVPLNTMSFEPKLSFETPVAKEFDFTMPAFEAVDPAPSMAIEVPTDENGALEVPDTMSADFSMSSFNLDPVSVLNPLAVEDALNAIEDVLSPEALLPVHAVVATPKEEPSAREDTQSLSGKPLEQLDIARFYISLNDYVGALDLITVLLDHSIDGIKIEAREMYISIPESVRAAYSTQTSTSAVTSS